jgi:hypothetical protein
VPSPVVETAGAEQELRGGRSGGAILVLDEDDDPKARRGESDEGWYMGLDIAFWSLLALEAGSPCVCTLTKSLDLPA